MRSPLLILSILLLAVVSPTACQKPEEPRPTPFNLLIVSIDTLRPDHLGCYGYDRPTSPNIDRLAATGHRFENAFTTLPTTLPAHTSLFTSLYPTQHSSRRNGENVPQEATMLAEILLEQGYRTAGFVSATVLDSRHGLAQGFEAYGDVGEVRKLAAETTLTRAREWLDSYDGSAPFFLFVHLYDPHAPYEAPEKFRKLMGARDEPLPRGPKWVVDHEQMTPDYVAATAAAYDAEIAYSDWAVGELMADLKRREFDEQTLVVLTADHGETLMELYERFDYAYGHGQFLYTHQVQIPLIFRLPHGAAANEPAVHAQPVSIIDISPTLLDLLGSGFPEAVEGQSLRALLEGGDLPDRPVFAERRFFDNPKKSYLEGRDYAVIDGRWHYIQSSARPDEFYDIAEDRAEANNLGEGHETARRLNEMLNDWLSRLKPRFRPPEFDTDPATRERLRSLGYVE